MRRTSLWWVFVLAALVSASCTAKYIRPTTDEKVEATPARVERGKYIVTTVGACGGCHASRAGGSLAGPEDADRPLSGGNWVAEGGMGIYVPNISSDAETGVGKWTDDELIRVIRDGIDRNGKILFPIMPYTSYQYMSDEDVRSVVAYLRTVPPSKPELARREHDLPFMVRTSIGMGAASHLPVKDVKAPSPDDQLSYGKYVARLGHCPDCHNFGTNGPRDETDRFMAGGDSPNELEGVGKVWSANLTPDPETGLGRYSADQIKGALRSGKRLDGKLMAPPMSVLLPHYAQMSDTDLDALVAWLRSLPPVKQKTPARELTPELAKMLGD